MGARVASVALLAAGLLLGPAVPVAAAPTPVAAPRWSMVPMTKDADGDGAVDGDGGVPVRGARTLEPSPQLVGSGDGIAQPDERLIGGVLSWYLDPQGYPVRLDACRSTGTAYAWSIDGPAGRVTTPERALRAGTCRTTVLLPEGPHALTLTVRKGRASTSTTIPADIRNILFVAFGDSYASGEGNPRNVEAWLRSGMGGVRPYWDDAACARSVLGAPARAALALERASSRTSVTLVDVACSGATIDAGILGPQPGQPAGQLAQVRSIIGDRPIDVATVSIGGNDIGFGSVLRTCATRSDCPISPPAGRLSRHRTLQEGIQAQLGVLPEGFARIAQCLGGAACSAGAPLRLAPGARVLPTMYPDITRATGGQPCTYLTLEAKDMAWARSTILLPNPSGTYAYPSSGGPVTLDLPNGSLNSQVAATAGLGWQPVARAWAASGESPRGHGICAGPTAWAFGLTALSGLPAASFHPTPRGHAVIAEAILAALTSPVKLVLARTASSTGRAADS